MAKIRHLAIFGRLWRSLAIQLPRFSHASTTLLPRFYHAYRPLAFLASLASLASLACVFPAVVYLLAISPRKLRFGGTD